MKKNIDKLKFIISKWKEWSFKSKIKSKEKNSIIEKELNLFRESSKNKKIFIKFKYKISKKKYKNTNQNKFS